MGQIVAGLNGRWHKLALQVFMAMILAHWAEHVLQAVEVFVMGWPRPEARGALGLVFPWLVTSESLHYVYAIITLVGLYLLWPAFLGQDRLWWTAPQGA